MGLHTHTVTKYWVHCDRCGRTPDMAAYSQTEAEVIAQAQGFVSYKHAGFHVCPDCYQTYEAELEQTWNAAHLDLTEVVK